MCVRTVGGEEDIQLVHGVQPVLDAPEMTWWKILFILTFVLIPIWWNFWKKLEYQKVADH